MAFLYSTSVVIIYQALDQATLEITNERLDRVFNVDGKYTSQRCDDRSNAH